MNKGLMTEEFGTKKDYKKFIIPGVIIIVLILIIVGIVSLVKNIVESKKNSTVVTTLNEELKDIKRFGIVNNNIVGINDNLSTVKIYNLLQGTGQFGEFTDYFYHDNKLYLMFSDNSIYAISLDKGDNVYELEKLYSLGSIICKDGNTSKTTDLAFVNNTMYFNESSCGLSSVNLKKNNTYKLLSTEGFDYPKSYIEYSSKTKSLYLYYNSNIYKYELKTGNVSVIVNNVNTDIFTLNDNVLVYSNTVNNVKTYYGYNIINDKNTSIVENARELVVYNKTFIYRTDNSINIIGKKNKEIYKVHYNNLKNMVLIGDTLQVVDFDSIDETKVRNVNIDLKNKYTTTINENEYSNIVEYK